MAVREEIVINHTLGYANGSEASSDGRRVDGAVSISTLYGTRWDYKHAINSTQTLRDDSTDGSFVDLAVTSPPS